MTPWRFFTISFSLCLRFVSRIAFTTLIGYYIDEFLGTPPYFMILSVILGSYIGWTSLMKIWVKKFNA